MKLLKLFYFTGRASREEFGLVLLWGMSALVGPSVAARFFFELPLEYYQDVRVWLLHLAIRGTICAALWIMAATAARRMHDQGDGAIGLLVALIPLVGWVLLAIVLMHPGDKGPNKYGPDPLGPGPADALENIFR